MIKYTSRPSFELSHCISISSLPLKTFVNSSLMLLNNTFYVLPQLNFTFSSMILFNRAVTLDTLDSFKIKFIMSKILQTSIFDYDAGMSTIANCFNTTWISFYTGFRDNLDMHILLLVFYAAIHQE